MFTISKSLVIAVAAIATTATASAEAGTQVAFRFDRNASVEQNYEAFARIAKRACKDVSPLGGSKGRRACSRDLLDQAVAATKQGAMISYYRRVTDPQQTSVSLSSR